MPFDKHDETRGEAIADGLRQDGLSQDDLRQDAMDGADAAGEGAPAGRGRPDTRSAQPAVTERAGRFYADFGPVLRSRSLEEADHALHARIRTAVFYVNECRLTIDDDTRAHYLCRLNNIASCPTAACGMLQLESFEKDFEPELKKHRDRYVGAASSIWIGVTVLSLALTAGLVAGDAIWGAALRNGSETVLGGTFLGGIEAVETLRYLFIWTWGATGLAIGEMFAARYDAQSPKYATFFAEARFRFDPRQRVVFVALTWTILVFLLAHGWLDLTMGGLQLSGVEDAPWSAAVLGMMTSIGFQHLLGVISRRMTPKDG